MLGDGDTNGSGVDPRASRAAARATGSAARARFAGLDLRLAGDPELCACWLRAAGGGVGPEPLASPALPLRCQLEPAPRAPAPAPPGLEWEWDGPSGRVRAPLGEAWVQREPGGYRADVRVARDAHAARLLLVGLAAQLAHLHGGACLHAASVALDGGALAFIGPSGAGKSTACDQVSGAAPFAVDRLLVLPGPAGSAAPWLAHPLPGGSPRRGELGRAPRWLPLRALLRVCPSPGGSRVEPCPAPRAVLLARESAFQLGRGPGAERALLAALERLARQVGVARVHVQLGADLTPLLRAHAARPREELT